jgi:cytochrome c556
MKTLPLVRRAMRPLLLLALMPVLLGTASAPKADPKDDGTAEVMRRKLDHSQQVLRGLATQDFALIATNAQRLVRLSQSGGWLVRQTPEYELFTMEFRRSAEELVRAASAKNIDGATVAYTQMTFSCVSCHKYMRQGRVQKTGLGH